MRNWQQGQSLIEFAISVMVLVVFLLAIPMIAKIANANIMTTQALDYAAWRVREGNIDNDVLSREVSDRYFAETALIVDNEKINNQGVKLGTGKDGQQIYEPDTVSINYIANSDKMSGANGAVWNQVNDDYNFHLYDKKGTVSINLPLQNLDVIPEITGSMTISKTLYVDNQTLAAPDAKHIQNQLRQANAIKILPYNNGLQKNTNKLTNAAITALRVATIGLIDEKTVKDVIVNESAVPNDRLATYQP